MVPRAEAPATMVRLCASSIVFAPAACHTAMVSTTGAMPEPEEFHRVVLHALSTHRLSRREVVAEHAASFVYAVIDRLSRRYPRIVFHLVTTAQDALHRELSERNVDLLIAWERGADADERLAFEFLYDDSYVVVAGAQNPWTRRRKINLAELVSESWTLPPQDSVLGAAIMEAFRATGLAQPRTTVVTMPGEVRTKLLATGRFLSVYPASALKFSTERPKLQVLPVELPLARLPVGIVTLKSRTLSPVAQLFIEHAREVAKPLARRK